MTDQLSTESQPLPSLVRVYKTQADAVSYLRDAGYKISTATFSRAVTARKVPTNADGHFEENVLLAYAGAHREPTVKVENKSIATATAEKTSAAAEKDRWMAARQKLKFEKEQDKLMPKAEYERNLAARALFFKNEVRNFIHLHGAAMIRLAEGEEAKLPALVRFWDEKTAIWMDTWSEEREFSIDAGGDDDEDAGAEITNSKTAGESG